MDRPIVYPGQVPRSLDNLTLGQFAMVALAKLSEATLGTSTVVAQGSFTVSPTSPASLNVAIGPGQIFQLENLEGTAIAGTSVGPDSHTILKQGINLDAQSQTLAPPSAVGYAQTVLVQVQYADYDDGQLLLTYQNPNDKTQTFQGPGGNGLKQNTIRRGIASVTLKSGIAAPAGQQVTPTPDAGFVGLYVVTLGYGQTTITTGNIAPYANAPFIPVTLPGVPAGVQSGQWVFGAASGANTYSATLFSTSANPFALVTGMEILVFFANANTATAATLNANVTGAKPIVRQSGGAPAPGDLTGFVPLVYDGASWRCNGLVPSDVYGGVKLTANYTLYVNASTGNDANPGTSALPLRTLQAAVNYVQQTLNLNGQVVTVNCTGTFTAGAKVYGPFLGSNSPVQFIFNGMPGSSVAATNDVCFLAAYGASFSVQGAFALSATGSSGTAGVGLYAGNASTIYHSGLTFGACAVAHTYSQNSSFINAVGNYTIAAGAPAHAAVQGGTIQITNVTVTFTAAVTFTNFVSATYAGFILSQNAIWSSTFSITGSRFSCSFGGGCSVYGAGINYFPGSTAGVVSSATYGVYA